MRLLRSVLALLVAALMAACGKPSPQAADGPVLVFARGADAQRLDPADVDDGESVNTLAPVLEGLVRFKPGTTEIEPWLAESWEFAEGGRVLRFRVREGVVFHDGTPLNAETARFTFARQLEPGHPARFPDSAFSYWGSLYRGVREVVAVDERTLEFRLEEPDATILPALAIFPAWLVSPAAFERLGQGMVREPVGTGPFVFESWRPNDAVTYRRFDRYWGEPAGHARLVLRVVPDNTARLVELRAGRLGGIDGLQPAELATVSADPSLVVHRAPALNVAYLAFGPGSSDYATPAFRRAVAMAIDREALVAIGLSGAGAVALSPLPPGFAADAFEPALPPHDEAAARTALEAIPGATGREVELATFAEPRPYLPDPARATSLLRRDLESAGLRVKVVSRDFKSHLDVVRHGRFELALLGWIGDYPDPDNFLTPLLASWSATEGSATNIAFHRDRGLDSLLVAARAATAPDNRKQLYGQALGRWARDLPILPLVHADQVTVLRRGITGYVIDPTGIHHFGPLRPAKP